jgi:Xaa-Pro aminopeptidase
MNVENFSRESAIISEILKKAPTFDKELRVTTKEFKERQRKVYEAINAAGYSCAVIYSNEQYDGDVPYLGGNTNITVEPVLGIIGKNGFYILTGLEGGYVVEQLSARSGAEVHKVKMLQLADEEYPIEASRVEDVIEKAVGKKPDSIALLTPRAVFPLSVYDFLRNYLGSEEAIVDEQEIYYKIKYEKSDMELRLTEEAAKITDFMVEGMASVIKPGMYETQVAKWGYAIAFELGVEELGLDVIVNANTSNRSLIGKALNRKINEGDIVHVGCVARRDGLNACERMSVVCTKDPKNVTAEQKYWFDFIEQAYRVAETSFKKVASGNLPARVVEEDVVNYFRSYSEEVSKKIGKSIDLAKQKPYTTVHNGGYTEYAEFYGAITLNSNEPLGNKVVNMVDMAIRGIGNYWDDIVIPGLDYIVVEKTLGKSGSEVKVYNDLPINIQHFVGRNF